MIKEIGRFIEALTGCDFEIGRNLFIGHLPLKRADGTDIPVRCIVVLEAAGGTLVPDLPDWMEKAVQIWNRAASYFEAREDAYCIYISIHGTAGWTLPVVMGPTYTAMVINAIGPPAPLENPNEKGQFVFSTNYQWSLENAP
jgi:hypothetical protein